MIGSAPRGTTRNTRSQNRVRPADGRAGSPSPGRPRRISSGGAPDRCVPDEQRALVGDVEAAAVGTDREIEVQRLVAPGELPGECAELLRHQPLHVRMEANTRPSSALDAPAEPRVLERQRGWRREPAIERRAPGGGEIEPAERAFDRRPARRGQAGQIDEAAW